MALSMPLPPDIHARLTNREFSEETEQEEGLFRLIGTAGALFRERAIQQASGEALDQLINANLVRISRPLIGEVVSLTRQGREMYAEITGHRPDYLERPNSLADRAFQVEAIIHLRPWFTVIGRKMKSRPGLPRSPLASGTDGKHRGEAEGKVTDQVVAFHIESTDQTPAFLLNGRVATAQQLRRAPLLYCLGASAPVTRETIKRLRLEHRRHVMDWSARLVLAVPYLTPELDREMAELQARVGNRLGQRPAISAFEVPILVVVPPVHVPNN